MGDDVGVLVGHVFPVRVDVAVRRSIVVDVGVDVVEAAPPPKEKPDGEEHDDHADERLGGLLNRLGQKTIEKD